MGMNSSSVPTAQDLPRTSVTVSQFAESFGLRSQSVRAYISQGKVASFKFNGRRLIPFAYLEACVEHAAKTSADFLAVAILTAPGDVLADALRQRALVKGASA